MKNKKLRFRVHAIQRMFERRINEDDVQKIIEKWEVIAEYLDDKPFPSRLILGYVQSRPLHLVIAQNDADDELIVITVYEPDQEKWELGFRNRRPK